MKFYHSYLDRINQEEIRKYCRQCGDYKDGLCELINDAAGPIERFCNCDALQERF